MTAKVILASGSPRRRELLRALVPEYDVVSPDIPEPLTGDARRDAETLAVAKARAIADQHPEAVVIGADTIVHDGTTLYGKPADAADAMRMLAELAGRQHEVVTGIAVSTLGAVTSAISTADVRIASLGSQTIAAYVATGVPLDKAGAYAIQDDGFGIVERSTGCYCCVVGLPLWRLRALLTAAGVECDEPSTSIARCVLCPERPV